MTARKTALSSESVGVVSQQEGAEFGVADLAMAFLGTRGCGQGRRGRRSHGLHLGEQLPKDADGGAVRDVANESRTEARWI